MPTARDRIIALPNPHLRERSSKIKVIDTSVKQVVEDMKAAVIDWEENREHEVGVALAAIQIDDARRIIIIRNNYNDKEDKSFTTFLNPVITKYEGVVEDDFEGCLSIQDVYGKVPRYSKVRVKAMGLDGKDFRIRADGFLARVLQHEIDHMNGVMFIDHIKHAKLAFFKLNKDGNLEQLDYDKAIKSNRILW